MHKFSNLLVSSFFGVVFILGCGTSKPNDAQLATSIKAQMFSNPQTKTADLQVSVKSGVVTLSGDAPSDAARYEAYKLAASTPGVTKVNDQMTVQSPQQTAQATLNASSSTPTETPAAPVTESMPVRKARPPKKHRARHADAIGSERNAISEPPVAPNLAQASTASAAQATLATELQQSATQPATASPPAQAPAPQAAAASQPPPRPQTAVFPAGTTVEVQTVDPIDSKTGQAGDEFQATLAQPLSWNGNVLVPKGVSIYLRLVAVQTSGQYKGRSELQLQLVRLEFQGAEYHLNSTSYTEAGSSRGKNTAEKVGGGAILGAIIGAVAGGGKGAAIGGAVGAAAGGVYQGVSKPKQIRIPAETLLDFKLEQPLNIPLASNGAQ